MVIDAHRHDPLSKLAHLYEIEGKKKLACVCSEKGFIGVGLETSSSLMVFTGQLRGSECGVLPCLLGVWGRI